MLLPVCFAYHFRFISYIHYLMSNDSQIQWNLICQLYTNIWKVWYIEEKFMPTLFLNGTSTSISLDYYIAWFFFMFKKVSESHWCKEIKKLLWCSGKIIDSVLLDDEILNFLDQNILADFRHCICIPQKLKFFLKYRVIHIL